MAPRTPSMRRESTAVVAVNAARFAARGSAAGDELAVGGSDASGTGERAQESGIGGWMFRSAGRALIARGVITYEEDPPSSSSSTAGCMAI